MNIKRRVYGLPIMSWYRGYRTRTLAARPARHPGGFLFAGGATYFDPAWEKEERAFLQDQMLSRPVFIDVGANQGFYTCLAASLGLTVAAVEPEAGNLRFLLANVQRNDFPVEVFAVAVGSTPAVLRLFGDGDTASLSRGWSGAHDAFSALVPVNNLDHLFADRWPGERLLIKIDVEGVEDQALAGAVRLLARQPRPTWLIETLPRQFNRARTPNPAFARVLAIMADAGYRCRHSETGNLVDAGQVRRWADGEDVGTLDRGNFAFTPDVADQADGRVVVERAIG